jgi:hypothetical protein
MFPLFKKDRRQHYDGIIASYGLVSLFYEDHYYVYLKDAILADYWDVSKVKKLYKKHGVEFPPTEFFTTPLQDFFTENFTSVELESDYRNTGFMYGYLPESTLFLLTEPGRKSVLFLPDESGKREWQNTKQWLKKQPNLHRVFPEYI